MRFTIDFIEIFAEKADREAPSKMPIHPSAVVEDKDGESVKGKVNRKWT